MGTWRNTDRVRGAIHDLEIIETLSDVADKVLCVSDRSLYLIQNWAEKDATFAARYALSQPSDVFESVTDLDAIPWALYLDTVNRLQLEVRDVTCDLTALLEELNSNIKSLQAATTAGAGICCGYTIDPQNYYEPESGAGDPQDACDRAWSLADYWGQGANEMYHQWVMGAFPAAGVLTAILDQFDLPASIVLEIVTFGASQALPMLEAAWNVIVEDVKQLLVCAMLNNGDSASAQAAFVSAVEAIPDLHPTAITLLTTPVSISALNQYYDGTWPITSTGNDCSGCFEEEGLLVLTNPVHPYNVLVIGEDIEFESSDPAWGYRSQNSGTALDCYFNVSTTVQHWIFFAEVYVEGGAADNAVFVIQRWSGEGWFNFSEDYILNVPSQTWTNFNLSVNDDILDQPGAFRLHLNCQGFNNFMRWRKIYFRDITQ